MSALVKDQAGPASKSLPTFIADMLQLLFPIFPMHALVENQGATLSKAQLTNFTDMKLPFLNGALHGVWRRRWGHLLICAKNLDCHFAPRQPATSPAQERRRREHIKRLLIQFF